MHGGLTLWLKVETRRCRSGSVGLSSESRCDENINPVVCVSAGSAGPFCLSVLGTQSHTRDEGWGKQRQRDAGW